MFVGALLRPKICMMDATVGGWRSAIFKAWNAKSRFIRLLTTSRRSFACKR